MVLGFVVSHNLYLYNIRNCGLSSFDKKTWYNIELFLFIAPLLKMGTYPDKTQREIEFTKIAWIVLTAITGITIFNQFGLIPAPALQVYYFNGITFAYTLYALLLSDKNGDI